MTTPAVFSPGINISMTPGVVPQTPPTETGTAFVVGVTEMGRVDRPVRITSLLEYITYFGARVAYGILYDWLDAFFNEAGGGQVYVMRVVGPAGTVDTVTFDDSTSAASIEVQSVGPGSTGFEAAIVSGQSPDSFQIQVTNLPDGGTLQSTDLLTVAEAVSWGSAQRLINVVALGANPPANNVLVALTGGADDRSNITDEERTDALDLIPDTLGPGQVAIPGATTETCWVALYNHAALNNRFALPDAPDTNSIDSLIGYAVAIQADSGVITNAVEDGLFLTDWQTIPGLTPQSTRAVPPSAIVAALIARSDKATGNPNLAAAGANGQVQYATGKTQPTDWSLAQITKLVASGVNPFRYVYGGLRFYGFSTLAFAATDPVFSMGSASRLRMAIYDQGRKIGESVLMDQIDGQGHEQAKYGGRITAMLLAYYAMDAIFGATGPDAYIVDVGADVNTPASIANRELHAAVGIRPSPFAQMVFFQLAAYTVAQPV
jgi:phage tail sheath protein FI